MNMPDFHPSESIYSFSSVLVFSITDWFETQYFRTFCALRWPFKVFIESVARQAGWPNPESTVSLQPFQKNDPFFPRSASMCIFVFPSFAAFVTQLYKNPLKPGKRLVICYSPKTCFRKPHVGLFIGYLYPHKWCPPLGVRNSEDDEGLGLGGHILQKVRLNPFEDILETRWNPCWASYTVLSFSQAYTEHSAFLSMWECLWISLYPIIHLQDIQYFVSLCVVWKGFFGEVPNIIQLFLREKSGHWSEAIVIIQVHLSVWQLWPFFHAHFEIMNICHIH